MSYLLLFLPPGSVSSQSLAPVFVISLGEYIPFLGSLLHNTVTNVFQTLNSNCDCWQKKFLVFHLFVAYSILFFTAEVYIQLY